MKKTDRTTGKLLLLFFALLFAVNFSLAQNTTALTGAVLDAKNNLPVEGASISTTAGRVLAVTNSKGIFTLQLKDTTATVWVKATGFKSQTIPLNGNNANMVVLLEINVHELDSVTVSTGYQVLSRERATGSFTKINSQVLNQQAGSNIIARLRGVASSVLFDNSLSRPSVTIRGISTYEGISTPLIVVNNFPYDGNINNINPNDVESITILKDAAAASIWGTRAGNGVIVITTKQGSFNQPLKIQLNANVTTVKKPDLFYLHTMSSPDFIDAETFLFGKGFYPEYTYNHAALSPVVELLIAKRDGTMPADEADAAINALRSVDVRNDFDKYVYQNALNRQYALNISGGGNVANYYLSAGYDNNADVTDAGYKRITLKSATVLKPVKNLQVTASLTYTQSEIKSGKPAYGSITPKAGYALYPYAMLADANGEPLPVIKDYRAPFIDTVGNGKLVDWNYYPLSDYKHATNKNTGNDILAAIAVQYNIFRGFNASVEYNFEQQQSAQKLLYDEESYYARNLVNQFTQIDPVTGATTYPVPVGGILDLGNTNLESNDLRGSLSYQYTRGNSHLALLAGGELRQTSSRSSLYRTYGYNDDVLTFGNTDLVNPYKSLVTGFNAYIQTPDAFSEALNRFVSAYGNAAYTFKEKYTLTASIRKDASNLFGVNSNQRGIPLWSAGAAWYLSKEPFYKFSFIPLLKLRFSYGFSGNADVNRSAVTVLSYIPGARFTNLPYANITQYANPDLGWELTKIINAGIDFNLKNNIAGGSVEYYIKEGSGLFGPAPLDQTTGLQRNTITKNVADMKGHGVDIDLYVKPLDRVFKWTVNFLFSYNLSKVTDYYLPDNNGANYVGNAGVSPVVGEPVYALLSFKWAGLDPETGDPMGYINKKPSKDYNAIFNGKTKIKDLDIKGPLVPPVFGSLRNSFTWKHFALEANITYRLGYYFRKPSMNYYAFFYGWYGNADFAKRWQQPGDEKHTYVPSMVYPANYYRDNFYTNSAVLVDKADNIRLEFINLSYTIDKLNWKRSPFSSLNIYGYASNLGILWKANKDNPDPDFPNSLKPGPGFTMGVNVNF